MGWLGKLLGGDEAKAAPAPAAKAAPVGSAGEPASGAEVDAVFYRWLAAAGPQQASAEVEKQIIDELTRLAQSPVAGAALVPRVPAIIPQLMRTLRDDDMNAAELSRQLSQDVVLVAEVYREANRPCYRPRYNASPPIDTIEGAIMLLGQNGMRMLLARVAFRPIISMQNGVLAKRTAPLIWRQSEKCAQAASLLAPSMRANAFEAYLAGLMANVGIVVAFRLIDQMYTEEAVPQSDEFIDELFAQGRILSARIAELWEFPAPVTSAIEQAGQEDAPALAQALALGDRVSKLRMLVDATRFVHDDPFVVDGLSKAALACFDKLEDDEDE
ncbi:HDOD domain-containing protein [Massilia sp. GCM10020059]|uniref:HDOD domain-containing protein n=1 Tax=Massilia agrisoli TaxID=2892444 RepID=A0ABS8ISG5_9BURK|nr:HDOD domain-containing protein [Massilia agrisoli]MCC6071355.1 HDOD domain-containing protein [Massilia agrisoli]